MTAVIYDLDDTMVDSDPLHARAWQELLFEHDHDFRALPEQIRAHFIGMRVVDIVDELVDLLRIDCDKQTFYRRRSELYLDLVKTELKPMPGLKTSLDRLTDAGYPLGVASSGARKYIELVLDKFGISTYFATVVTGDDVTTGKPDPETYLVAADRLGVSPATCVVLEDATKGIRAAKSAGCRCIAIKSPSTPPQDFSQADLTLDSLDDVTPDVVARLTGAA